MDITKKQNAGKTTLELSGRLDTKNAPHLQEVLIPEFDSENEIELDFAGLTYVSSAGLRVLLSGEKTAKEKGRGLILVNVSSEIIKILEMTGLRDFFHIE